MNNGVFITVFFSFNFKIFASCNIEHSSIEILLNKYAYLSKKGLKNYRWVLKVFYLMIYI